MKVKLRFDKGNKPAQTLTLRGPEAVIGRATGNAVRIPCNDVSRRHCRICIRKDRVTIEDLDSLNGTYLNSKRVQGIRELHPGDRIRIGPVTFLVDFVPDSPQPVDLDDLELVDAEEIDVALVEEEVIPPPQSESPTKKRKPLPGSDPSGKEKPSRKGSPPSAETEKDIGLVPVAGKPPPSPPAKPKKPLPPPPSGDDLLPLTGERPHEKNANDFIEGDQAWKVPDSSELRDILHGLEHGQSVKEEEEEK